MPQNRFRRPDYTPAPTPTPDEGPSGLRRLLAGGARFAGGLFPGGGLIGAGLSGGGELAAQLIEEVGTDKGFDLNRGDMARIGSQAAIGAVPLAKWLAPGKAAQSALKFGSITGGGEAGRQLAAGEDIDPLAVGLAGGLGAATGGVLSKFTSPVKTTAPKKSYTVETTVQPGGGAYNPKTKRIEPVLPPRAITASEEPLGLAGGPAVGPPRSGAPFGDPTGPAPYRRDARAAAKQAEKEALNKTKLDQIAQAIEEGGLTPGPASVSSTLRAETPEGGVEALRRVFSAPEEIAGVPTGRSPSGARTVPKVSPTGIGPGTQPWLPMEPPSLTPRPLGAKAPVTPRAPEAAPTVAPKATFIGWQETPSGPPIPLYNVLEGPSARSTVSTAKLQELGIPIPETPPAPGVATPPSAEMPSTDFMSALGQLAGKTVRKPGKPRTIKQQAAQDAYEALEAKIKAEAGGVAPSAPAEPMSGRIPSLKAADEAPGAYRDIEDLRSGATPRAGFGTEPVGEPATLFKTPTDVVGQAYRGAKGEEGINPLAKRYLGLSLQSEAKKAGLPTRGGGGGVEALQKFLGRDVSDDIAERVAGPLPEAPSVPRAPQGPAAGIPEVPPTAVPEAFPQAPVAPARSVGDLMERWSSEVEELQGMGMAPEKLDEASKLILNRLMDENPSIAQGFSKGTDGETGAIAPEALAQILMGAGGAIGGSFLADDPIIGALAGAGAGLGLPHILKGIQALGVSPDSLGNIREQLGSPEGIRDVAQKIGRALPHVQRFNYLTSAAGLPANVFVGPYGAAITGALTKGLSGDPRGWAALRELTPQNFMREFMAARKEAQDLIRRTQQAGIRHEGGAATEDIPGVMGRLAQAPAEAMTMGDVSSRNILQRAGFTEEEARAFTLTSEPELPFFSKLANLRRGERSPMMEMMLPFVRTPANIVEQGAHSTPGLGFLTQAARETPDALQEQLVQQALGGAAGVGGYLAGENLDPETARFLRRYVTNASGRYGLLSGLGFTAGQASRQGQPLVSRRTMLDLQRSFPLPTAEPITDAVQAVASGGRVPRGAVPNILFETGLVSDTAERAPTTLRPIAGRQQNRFRRQ